MYTSGNHIFAPGQEVAHTPELERILRSPRREWSEASAQTLASMLTPLLSRPGGTMALRPIQAQALHDAGVHGGGFFPIRVGGGKTLLSLLLAYVIGLRRPLLLIPASLKEKTKREARELAKHWRIPFEILRIESYEQLSTPQSKYMLLNYLPDGILTDESHRLKSTKAAVTKRVDEYMDKYPSTVFAAMSGTITKRSIKDYAHILRWCLKDRAPVPRVWNEMEKWSQALDEKLKSIARVHPGALLQMTTPEDWTEAEGDEVRAARLGYRRVLAETPGVVCTTEGFAGSSIYIDTDILPAKESSASIEGAFTHLRDDGLTPDDWPLTDSMSIWRHARELAIGFYYRWSPRPPPEWLMARKVWFTHIREILKHNQLRLDSDFVVTRQVTSHPEWDNDAYQALQVWRQVEPTFVPNTEAVWFDDTVIQRVAKWLSKHPRGIAWVEHTTFGERLAATTGLPYFGRGGKDAHGRAIDGGEYLGPCIASVASNSTGRNLQWWCDNYLVSCPPGGAAWEQLLGRTHREGQEADEIHTTVLIACIEHYDALVRATNDAQYIQDSTGQAQKLLYADVTLPERWDMMGMPSRRYQR